MKIQFPQEYNQYTEMLWKCFRMVFDKRASLRACSFFRENSSLFSPFLALFIYIIGQVISSPSVLAITAVSSIFAN